MKKILILANSDKGLYNFRNELIQRMVTEKYEIFVSVPDNGYVSEIEKLGCKVLGTTINRRGMNPLKDFKLLINYIKLLKKVKPNVVLTYTIKPNIYGGIACRLKRVPYLVNITGLGTAVENKGVLSKILLKLYKFALKKAKCVFFQNKTNKALFENKKIVHENACLIPGSGVNLCNFMPQEYPKNEDKFKFLFISRIIKEKGIDLYIDTAKYIKDKYPNIEFRIIGMCETKEYKELLDKLNKEGIIKYYGFQKDVKKFIKDCNCLIHPTYYPEGMSNVVLEAQASARPVITTNISGCKEIIDNDINGYIVSPNNLQELKNAVIKFIDLPYQEKVNMGLIGRKKVEQEFDREIVVEKYLKEIGRV